MDAARNKGGASLRKGIMVVVTVERGGAAMPTSEASLASCKSRSHVSKASSWSYSYNSLPRKSRSPATSLSIAVTVERGGAAVPTSEASLTSCKSRSHMSKASSWSHSYNSLPRKSRSPATSLHRNNAK